MKMWLIMISVCWLAVSPLCAGHVILTWDPSPGAAGYAMHWGTASGQYAHALDTGPATQVTLMDLTTGHPYYFAVRAYSLAGTRSDFSNEVRAVAVDPPALDTTAPTVTLTKPLHGSTVQRRSQVTLEALVSDDRGGVREVTFTVGQGATVEKTCNDQSAPYTCVWSVPGRRGRVYHVRAVATDASGNRSTPSVVEVTVK